MPSFRPTCFTSTAWPPLGFRVGDDCAPVPDAAEQALIAYARTLRADGAALRAIKAVLEAEHGRNVRRQALQRYRGRALVAPQTTTSRLLQWGQPTLSTRRCPSSAILGVSTGCAGTA